MGVLLLDLAVQCRERLLGEFPLIYSSRRLLLVGGGIVVLLERVEVCFSLCNCIIVVRMRAFPCSMSALAAVEAQDFVWGVRAAALLLRPVLDRS